MQLLIKAILIIAGIIHLLPLPGVIGAAYLERLYGLPFDEPNLVILMRHRAVPYGLVGAFLIYAAFRTDLLWVAVLGGLVSAASFVGVAWSVGAYNESIARVVIADLIAVACLTVAGAVRLLAAPTR